MTLLACLALLVAGGQLPGHRLPALEFRPEASAWREVALSGRPLLDGNHVGALGNDGKLLIGWSDLKTMEVYDFQTDTASHFVNVFVVDAKPKSPLILTDAQLAGLDKESPRVLGGPDGKVLAAFGDAYIVAVHESTAPFTIGEINPKRRGLDANRILGTVSAELKSQIWSQGDDRTFSIASLGLTTKPKPGANLAVYELNISRTSPVLKKTRSYPLPLQFARFVQDVDTQSHLAISTERSPQNLATSALLRDLHSGETVRIPLPDPVLKSRKEPLLKLANGRILCWVVGRNPEEPGELFLSTNRKTWRSLGPFDVAAVSFDRKSVLLRNPKQVWLCPVSQL